MLKEKLTFKRETATLLTVDLSAPTTEGYAMAFLKLFNNAREYPKMIYSLTNSHHSNNVYVVCPKKSCDSIKEFCTGLCVEHDRETNKPVYIGKVIDERDVIVGILVYEYNSTFSPDDERWDEDIDNAVDFWANVREE